MGKFRGAGHPDDIAVVNRNRVTVLLSNGDGTFELHGPFAAAGGATDIALADVGTTENNNQLDGKLDVVVTSTSHAVAAVLFGMGNGDLRVPADTRYDLFGGAAALILADFNGDGCADALMGNHDRFDGGLVSQMIGRCNNSDSLGSFFATSSTTNLNFSLDSIPAGLVPVQLNGDAKIDFAVTDRKQNRVALFLNTSSGLSLIFADPLFCAVGKSPRGIAAGDFNGDTIDDLAITNSDSDDVSILLGDGAGTTCPTDVRITP